MAQLAFSGQWIIILGWEMTDRATEVEATINPPPLVDDVPRRLAIERTTFTSTSIERCRA